MAPAPIINTLDSDVKATKERPTTEANPYSRVFPFV